MFSPISDKNFDDSKSSKRKVVLIKLFRSTSLFTVKNKIGLGFGFVCIYRTTEELYSDYSDKMLLADFRCRLWCALILHDRVCTTVVHFESRLWLSRLCLRWRNVQNNVQRRRYMFWQFKKSRSTATAFLTTRYQFCWSEVKLLSFECWSKWAIDRRHSEQ